ncbi:leucine zipper putative tumor suppressor 2-like [Phoenix dactylifera]|uniref:Leucine zipper putative tumor suppressor 2-like n=1 Tax=Phoenix dactylifera TaxID=42345 RepID=A0A8B8ZKU4_PHODC|nr:leucine zipper putative tumor suppressor 2-like [Phoenix dactylifera]
MVTKDAALYARFRKRAAEISGTSPEPKKKARLSSPETSAAQVGLSRPAAQVGPSRPAQEVPSTDHRGSGSTGTSAMLACLAPISQRPGRHPLEQRRSASEQRRSDSEPGSSQGAPRPPPPPPSPSRPSLPCPPEADPPPERWPYLPSWEVFEGDSALDDPAVARQVFHVALLPADQAKIRSQSYNSFMDGVYCSVVRRLHELETLMHIASDYRDRGRRYQRGQEKAEKKLRQAEARLGEVELLRQELLARVEAVEGELRSRTEELEEEKGAHALARSELHAAESRLSKAQSALAACEQEAEGAKLRAAELEGCVERAQEEA